MSTFGKQHYNQWWTSKSLDYICPATHTRFSFFLLLLYASKSKAWVEERKLQHHSAVSRRQLDTVLTTIHPFYHWHHSVLTLYLYIVSPSTITAIEKYDIHQFIFDPYLVSKLRTWCNPVSKIVALIREMGWLKDIWIISSPSLLKLHTEITNCSLIAASCN